MTCETSSVPCQVCEHRDQCPAWAGEPQCLTSVGTVTTTVIPSDERLQICGNCGVPVTLRSNGAGWAGNCPSCAVGYYWARESVISHRPGDLSPEVKALREQLRKAEGERDALKERVSRLMSGSKVEMCGDDRECRACAYVGRSCHDRLYADWDAIRAILDGAGERDATREDHDAAAQAVLDAMWRDGAGEG